MLSVWNGKMPCDDDCNINNLKILECQNNTIRKNYIIIIELLPETAKIANLEALYCIIPNKEIRLYSGNVNNTARN